MEHSLSIPRQRRPWWMIPFRGESVRDAWLDSLWPEWSKEWGEGYFPTVDYYEKDGKYHIKADLPGMDKNDISISIDKDVVTISGKKESSKEESGANYYLKESASGSFTRSFRLPGAVDEKKADATFKDGVLELVMSAKEGGKAQKIEIKG